MMIRNSFWLAMLKFKYLKSSPPDSRGYISGYLHKSLYKNKLCDLFNSIPVHIKCAPIGSLKHLKLSPLFTINTCSRCHLPSYLPHLLLQVSVNGILILMILKPTQFCWNFLNILLPLLLLTQKTQQLQ